MPVRNRGFTLLEILVVITLIALLLAAVRLSLRMDSDQPARQEADRLARRMAQMCQEAVLSGRPYALQLDEETGSYQFLVGGSTWEAVDPDSLFGPRKFSGSVELVLPPTQSATIACSTVGIVDAARIGLRSDSGNWDIVSGIAGVRVEAEVQ
ncbi:MAG: prepilin-type N-terminal cleavage/methylation domain-containing protein [Gammaproteobacteria bacterium]|nr:prepilin-type N-terminal cleavage/methylation domain-containing protein [Gammaproteobacteria bacterium]